MLVLAAGEGGIGEKVAPQEGGGCDHRRRLLAGFISVVHCSMCVESV